MIESFSVLFRMSSPEVHILSKVSVLSLPKRLIQSWRPRHRTRRRSRQAGIQEEAPLGCWRRRVSAEVVGGRGRPAAPVVTVPGETILPTVVGEVEGGGGGRRVPGEYNFQKQPTLSESLDQQGREGGYYLPRSIKLGSSPLGKSISSLFKNGE